MALGATVLAVALLSGRASVTSTDSPKSDQPASPATLENKIEEGTRKIEFKLEQLSNRLKTVPSAPPGDVSKNLLHLEAITVAAGAEDGTAGAAFMAISVTDISGKPVPDIDEGRFSFFTPATPSGVPGSITARHNPSERPGLYFVSVFPGNGTLKELWQQGDYLVSVTVDAPVGKGQAISRLSVPAKSGAQRNRE
jgi:hypothetical protein